jgi:hypothetical protein
MYPSSKKGNFDETTDMLPFYAYLNRLFRMTVITREGDGTKNGFEFSVFYFIWEEIKVISENPFKSCGYAPYLMHMIERMTASIFFCENEHHPLRIKNDLRAQVEVRRTAAP